MCELSVVVPVMNEAGSIGPFLHRLEPVLKGLVKNYEIIFCLDPSTDGSEQEINEFLAVNKSVKLIKFSRRFGQPAATMAGIRNCSGSACVVIDVDLQDPPELITEMYTKFRNGCDVVYATRLSRDGETIFKKFVSAVGYKVINKASEIEIPVNTGDFRLMSRRVVDHLCELKEGHGFLRGLVAFVGFRQESVFYERDARHSGNGKYNRLIGSLKIGLNGLVCFSSKPLQLMGVVGFGLATLSFLAGFTVFILKISGQDFPIGFATLYILLNFFFGVNLLALGVIGEYISRIYDELKGRPQYIIDKMVNFNVSDREM